MLSLITVEFLSVSEHEIFIIVGRYIDFNFLTFTTRKTSHCGGTKAGLKENPLFIILTDFPFKQFLVNAVQVKGKSFGSFVSKAFSLETQRKFLYESIFH